MESFARLFEELDQSNKTLDRIAALERYFQQAPDEDITWAIALFIGKKPKKAANSRQLRSWAVEIAALPEWLVEESYGVVGDLAETISLLLPPGEKKAPRTLAAWMDYLEKASNKAEADKKNDITSAWGNLSGTERFVFNKLITGGFRVGVSQQLLVKALSRYTALPENAITHRLMGDWKPATHSFRELMYVSDTKDELSKPYPFCLAYALDLPPASLGEPGQWIAEWKWDGIRTQLIRRKGEWFLWSRGEELLTERFPDLAGMAEKLPDGVVIDGELLAHFEGIPLSFNDLQPRISSKKASPRLMQQAPAHIVAYDLLEWDGADIRALHFQQRRERLETLVLQTGMPERLSLSAAIPFENWDSLVALHPKARELHAEGFMLKRKDSAYQTGRKRGEWWKWKVEPFQVDGVLVYAQRGHGRRANLYTDYTLAVWNNGELQPFAKAYSGLTDEELAEVDAFVKKNTLERFGPVRTVRPELVFEIGFEGIQASKRHKSGIALRFPRILRWRKDKKAEEADSLDTLMALLERYG